LHFGTRDFVPGAFRKRRKRLIGRASEIAAPLLRVASSALSRGASPEPRDWRNGLILSHSHVGDVLYRTCSLSHLRDVMPECRWSFLTTEQSADILGGNPFIDNVLTYSVGDNSWDLSKGGFAALRSERFDVALCTNTLRHYPDFILATALGIANRVGFTYKGLSGLITHPVPIEFPSGFPAYFRSMVAYLGAIEPDWELRPQLFPDGEDHAAAERVWSDYRLDNHRPVVACAITTRQAGPNWPPSLLLEILVEARGRVEFDLVLTGTSAEAARLTALGNTIGFPCHILAGTLSVRAFGAFLKKCDALLTLDSGSRHIGNAVGIPVLFLRNPSVSRIESGAYCDSETDLAPPVEYLGPDEVRKAAATFSVETAAGLLADQLIGKRSLSATHPG
jgi:ADP-heptose:LPS heptosyltransferase